jgi:hypothetical protein
MVHRMVCEAFHGPPPLSSDHADHIVVPSPDNHASNLRWLPAAVNMGRAIRRTPYGWESVSDEPPPVDYVPSGVTDEQLAAAGW